MRRLAVVMVMLALCAAAGVAVAAQVTLDSAVQPEARLSFAGETGDALEFAWTAGSATVEMNNNQMSVLLSGERVTYDEDAVASVKGMVRLPWNRDARLVITGGEVVPVSMLGIIGDAVSLDQAPVEAQWASLGTAGIWRDVTVAPLVINPVYKDDSGQSWVATKLDVRVEVTGMLDTPAEEPSRPVSRAFWPAYQEVLLNGLDELGTRLSDTQGSLVIVAPPLYTSQISEYIEWKTNRGFHVVVHDLASTPTYTDLSNELTEYYETLDPPLEYVLLLGDVNRGMVNIPHETIQNPAFPQEAPDATDWPYTFQEGNDYFPEFWIGRMPVGTPGEALSATRRVVQYESDPHRVPRTDEQRWLHASLVGGNYSESGDPPLSPLMTLEWLRNRFLTDWDYLVVDTLFWRNGGYQASESEIRNSVDDGPLYVAYRGWGDSDGWIAPNFRNNNVDQLSNEWNFPIVGSFVCNTGDFANNTNTKCFATTWITAGTATAPTGAVTVMAPTDLHTQTKFNNPLLGGAFTTIFDHDVTNLSAALFAGKMEIYNGHPTRTGSGDMVEFYHHVYHIIGDPSLQVWRWRPKAMHIADNFSNTVPYGQNYLDVRIADSETFWGLKDAHVQVTQEQGGDLVLIDGGWTDVQGQYNLNLAGVQTGELYLTVTRPDYEAIIDTINVWQPTHRVGVQSWTWNSGGNLGFFVGDEVEVDLTLINTGAESETGVSVTLSNENDELVTISTATVEYGNIAAGATAVNSTPFVFTLDEPLANDVELEFTAEITTGDRTFSGKIWIPIETVRMVYDGYAVASGSYMPNNTAELNLTFTNVGVMDANNVSVTLQSWHTGVTVTTGTASLGNVAAGATVTTQSPFTVQIAEGVYSGCPVTYSVFYSSDEGDLGSGAFQIALEGVSTTDPLGPDGHGYFAYDNTDTGFENADEVVPTYTAFDLSSMQGAVMHELRDDENLIMELPFDFTYYGEVYEAGNNFTISSNGWVSLEEEPNYTRLNFRNWNLPSALGPQTVIAPFWDDLKPPTNEFNVVYTYYDEANNRMLIQYLCHNKYGLPAIEYPEDFTLVLQDVADGTTPTNDDIIEIHYHDVSNVDSDNNGATVGIENHSHTAGLEYTYALSYPEAAAPIENGRAIRFTTMAPSDFVGVDDIQADAVPTQFALHNAYPNPFNSTTHIRFDLPDAASVRLTVYNVMGQEVARLVDRHMDAGKHNLSWNLGNNSLSSGIYFIRLQAGANAAMSKVIYMK